MNSEIFSRIVHSPTADEIVEMVMSTKDVSRFFTGAPTDKAMWLLIGGIVASVVGLVGLLPRSKAS